MKRLVIIIDVFLVTLIISSCSALFPNYGIMKNTDNFDLEQYGKGKLPFNKDSSDVNFEERCYSENITINDLSAKLKLSKSDRINKIDNNNYIIVCSKAISPNIKGIEFGPEPFYVYYNVNIIIHNDEIDIKVDNMIGKRSDALDNYPSKYNPYSVRRKEITVKPEHLKDSKCIRNGYLSDSYICCWRRVFIDAGNNVLSSI